MIFRPLQPLARWIICAWFCLMSLGAASAEEWYSVQPGDTLESIAAQFGISAAAISERNGLASASPIAVDQLLIIPVAGTVTPASEGNGGTAAAGSERTHIVQRGETLQIIAQLYSLDWQTLARANNIANANLIYAGQALIVPASGGQESAPALIPTLDRRHPFSRPWSARLHQRISAFTS